jgi:rhodanese-related sulfurtransferase
MPRRTRNSWGVDTVEIEFLLADLRAVPRNLQPAIRRAVADAAQAFLSDVREDASWSSRIPGAIRTRTSFAQRGSGIRVLVDKAKAPHARPYEGLSSGGMQFRHPVFGNRDVWVSQQARPFFMPNVEKHREKVLDAIETALMKTLPRR